MRTELPLREITTQELYMEVMRLRTQIQTHNHLTSGSQPFNGIINGDLRSGNYISGSSGWIIKKNGLIEAKDIILYNPTITNPIITGIKAGSEIAIQDWSHNMAFSATDHDTVAWASGSIKLLDSTTFSIDAGNTGAMSSITYIYFSKADSETVLQTTTTYSTALGSNKILIAVAQNVASGKKATFQILGGKALGGAGKLWTADDIAANSVTANLVGTNEIITNSANIANALIGNAHITGTITVGHTDAKCTDALADQTSAHDCQHPGDYTSAYTGALHIDCQGNITTIGTVTSGALVVGTTNKIWVNQGGDNVIAVGGATKTSAPFYVSAAGKIKHITLENTYAGSSPYYLLKNTNTFSVNNKAGIRATLYNGSGNYQTMGLLKFTPYGELRGRVYLQVAQNTTTLKNSLVSYVESGASGATTLLYQNIGIGGASFGGGISVVFVCNANTVPSSNPTGGGILYVEGGALKFRGSGGTVTTIANA